MTFCGNLLKNFSENLKQLTEINDFLLFLRFHENHRSMHCFQRQIRIPHVKIPLVNVYLLNFHRRHDFG